MSNFFNNAQADTYKANTVDIYLKDGTVIHSLVDGLDMDATFTVGVTTNYNRRFAVPNENIKYILEV